MNVREDQKIQIQQATDIVQLIGEHVALRPKGKEFMGLCPFHDDKNPSFHVVPQKQIYKCFSCGAGGDVFSFMMNYHKMGFPEALKFLAERAGIKIEDRRPPRRKKPAGGDDGEYAEVQYDEFGQPIEVEYDEGPSDRELISQANQQAISFFQALLKHAEHGKVARAYIEQRNISPQMVEEFAIGYAPDRWDGLAMTINEKAWNARAFRLAGLISKRQNASGDYDRLRHRLIFPIFDHLGRPIAFGGRKLREEDEPKYLNSPETALFNKSATLFGLHLAKQAIIAARTAVIVEGYTDVIACHQAGIRNVVATLGTALTQEHMMRLKHQADKVVLVFDADEAGQKAADRALEVFLGGSMDVAIAVLPGNADPAELLESENGVERWNEAIGGAMDALSFMLQRMGGQLVGVDTLSGKERLADEFITQLARLGMGQGSSIRRALVVSEVAQLLQLPESVVLERLERAKALIKRQNQRSFDGEEKNQEILPQEVAQGQFGYKLKAQQLAERQLIGCLLHHPEIFHMAIADGRTLDEAIVASQFIGTETGRLYDKIYQVLSEDRELTLAGLLGDLASEGLLDLANLATELESQVEAEWDAQDSENRMHWLQHTAAAAAEAIVDMDYERQYQQSRQDVNRLAGEADGESGRQDQLLRQIAERLAGKPSPIRIARIKRDNP